MIFNNDAHDGSILNHECKRKREPSRRIISQTSKECDAYSHNSVPNIQRRKRLSQLIREETVTCIAHTPIIQISRAKTSRIMIGILVIMLFYDTVWSFSILNHNTHGRSKQISSSFVFHSSLLASVDNARERERERERTTDTEIVVPPEPKQFKRHVPDSIEERLFSLTLSLSKSRREVQKKLHARQTSNIQSNSNANKSRLQMAKATLPHRRALIQLLRNPIPGPKSQPQIVNPQSFETNQTTMSTTLLLQTNLNQCCIQSIRAAGESNDYNSILLTLQAVIAANTSSKSRLVVEPRVFGEAFRALQSTNAGVTKLRTAWKLFMDYVRESEQEQSVGASELNAMINAMGSRGRTRMALDLFYSCTSSGEEADEDEDGNGGIRIQPDAYTASALFRVLEQSFDSIATNNRNSASTSHNSPTSSPSPTRASKPSTRSSSSPSWQWNEVCHILDRLSAQTSAFKSNSSDHNLKQHVEVLNNHVYAAALKVNEQASLRYPLSGDSEHNGATHALELLQRMKVCVYFLITNLFEALCATFFYDYTCLRSDEIKNQIITLVCY